MTNALKKISRIASEANQTLPTWNTTLSSVYSTGAAAALEDQVCYGAYRLAVFEALHYMSTHHKDLLKVDNNRIRYIMQTPRILGGVSDLLNVRVYDSIYT